MEVAAARASTKSRLGIKTDNTDLDDVIDEAVDKAVKRLYPLASKEVSVQTVDVSVDSLGETEVDLGSLVTPLEAARLVEAREYEGFYPVSEIYHHAGDLRVRQLNSGVTKLRLYGLTKYTLADIPTELEIAVIWYAMSDFYDFLAGSKRHYNIYMQYGGRQVENMRDESEAYDDKARVYLEEHTTIYGT